MLSEGEHVPSLPARAKTAFSCLDRSSLVRDFHTMDNRFPEPLEECQTVACE